MKIYATIALFLGFSCLWSLSAAGAAPGGVSSGEVEALLKPYLDISYRPDGASTVDGQYTLFADPSARFATPGLNCSGFVLAGTRALLGTKTTVEEAKKDRLGDSGQDSSHGEDWDFGWDLLLNLTDGQQRAYLLPLGGKADPALLDGYEATGFDFHAPGVFDGLLARIQKDHLYLLSFNRATTKKGYTHMHYHVGLMVMGDKGQIYMYQTTTDAKKSYRRNMSDPAEKTAFLRAFANTSSGHKKMAVLEVPMKEE